MFPTVPDFISRPYPDYVPDRFPDCVPDRFPDYVPDQLSTLFPIDFPNIFPTDSGLCTRPSSRPVLDPSHDPAPPRERGLPSRPVNQMASRLPAPFPSRGQQTRTFSHTYGRSGRSKTISARGGLSGYRPVSTGGLVTGRTLGSFTTDFLTVFRTRSPTVFAGYVPDRFPDLFPTRSVIPSRSVPPRKRGLPSRPVNQTAYHRPIQLPFCGKQTWNRFPRRRSRTP